MATDRVEPDDQTNTLKRKSNSLRLRSCLLVALALCLLACTGVFAFWKICIEMPGDNAVAHQESAKVQSMNDEAPAAKLSVKEELESYVAHLVSEIGERNLTHYKALNEAADWIQTRFQSYGYSVTRHTIEVNGLDCHNIIAEKTGASLPDEIIIVGGHYDSAEGTPGANDNGSGVAATLTLARIFSQLPTERTIRFVAFTNEEPPYFQREDLMGSLVYARQCRKNKDDIRAVLSLETMGYFSDEPGSQKYPQPLNLMYPDTGNFIGFVGNIGSRDLLHRVIKTFRESSTVPSEGASLPEFTPGVGWSDHWSFWQEDYQGIMITDTAPFRYPHYHLPTDTIDKIDSDRFARVVEGLVPVIQDLLNQ